MPIAHDLLPWTNEIYLDLFDDVSPFNFECGFYTIGV